MTFQHPQLLWLLVIPGLVAVNTRASVVSIPHPAAGELSMVPATWRARIAVIGTWLHVASLLLAVAALSRPQLVNTLTTVTSKGVDIALAVDLSSSMLAVDGGSPDRTRTRLAIAKEVIGNFVTRRSGDRIALVAFGARPYPVAPLTLDHHWLISALKELDTGAVEDGTALGDGLLAAVNRLRSSPAESRTVVIITDGRSNTGALTPSAAASVAATLAIKVHTVGIGGTGAALFPVEDPFGGISWREVAADLDEPVLKEIASVTGGKYFTAHGADSLGSVFREIDRLEKRKIEEKKRRTAKELFPYLLSLSLFLMMVQQILSSSRCRRLP